MPNKNTQSIVPSGFTLRHTLRGHSDTITRIAWSPDGHLLASPSVDKTIHLWDVQTGQLLQTLTGHSDRVNSVAWSPYDHVLASGSFDGTIRLWDAQTGQLLQTLTGHSGWVNSVAWSPNGRVLASGSEDATIRLWDAQTGQPLRDLLERLNFVNNLAWSLDEQVLASGSGDGTIRLWNAQTGQLLQLLRGHASAVFGVAWSPTERTLLASSSIDGTIRLWETKTGREARVLEGHTAGVTSISFSSDGRLLASKSCDDTIRVWRTSAWETVIVLTEVSSGHNTPSLTFHPTAPVLATLGEKDTVIRIWDLNITTLLETAPVTPSHYTNAKVVLVGDTGVGKSGLSLVLTGQPFVPTESTHGRRVWTFDSQEVERDDGRKEAHEILLWDLAGQPGYRLIHQLHLNEVAVALVVFDARSETDPFAGVDHWDRALRQAQNVEGNSALPMRKFLVAARTDRGGKGVSIERINTFVQELGFDGYCETSAKEGKNIAELAETIKNAIDWTALPKVSSTDLFQHIKAFLLAEKEAGRLLSTADDLYRAFLKSDNAPTEAEELHAQFETCIGRVESRGLIRRLSFGNFVLLQPEFLDAYASALVNAVKDEPDGIGSIAEEKARAGNFPVPTDERLKDKELEKLLLIAMVEDLLRHEIALREQADDGAYLVFPSQSTRENPDLPDPKGKAVIFGFEGPVLNIYATLVVRLSHSGLFMRKELWRNAVTYTTKVGGTYGVFLNNIGEGRAELMLFFDEAAREEVCFHFEEYVNAHLQRRALPQTIQRRRIFVCSTCGLILTDQQMQLLRQQGARHLDCFICGSRISLLDREERLAATPPSLVSAMDRAADQQRDRAAAQSTVQGKQETKDFDVFLCHNGKDKSRVKEIGERLREHSILPWLDEWELRPGLPWQRLLEQQIGQIKAAAVFVGKDGIGPWEQLELDAFLRQFVRRGNPVIPVILADAPQEPKLPIFLEGMTWVDFRKQDPDPMEQLIWGITGKRSPVR